MEEPVKTEYPYRGKLLTLRVDTVKLPNGQEAKREIVEHPGAAVIVAVDGAGQVLLVRQYRHAVGRDLLELPAGTRDKGERPDQTATRELEEETGYTAGRWDPLAHFYSSPGILTEEMYVYLARDLAEGTSRPESDEDLHLVKLPLNEAIRKVESGEIVDAKSIVGLLLAQKKLETTATP